jgi:tetratricopeptide (TPR) repeat protein
MTLASEYCYGIEMQRALERHKAGEAIVLPIILRPAYWQSIPFSHLQVLPTDAKPITTWVDRDEAFFDIARGINEVPQTLLARPAQKTKEQWLLEGKAFYDTQQHDKALAAYEQALLIDRKDENIYSSIGRIHLYSGHYEAALDAYEESIQLSATASAYLFKGMILQRLGKSADALGAYLKAREHGYQE